MANNTETLADVSAKPACHTSPAPTLGNAAAMRAALGRIRAELYNNTIIVRKLKYELFSLADAALSAPPRNCDRFATGEDALKAWQAYQRKHMEFDERWRTWDCIGWLLAPAADQKGEGDGSK